VVPMPSAISQRSTAEQRSGKQGNNRQGFHTCSPEMSESGDIENFLGRI
jgi:hypothetical protein